MTKKDAERLVEIVFESIIETLNHGEKIELRGFGSFRVRERGARRGRNPKTGDPVNIPAKRVPYFKPGKELKELINEEPPTTAQTSPSPEATGASSSSRIETKMITACLPALVYRIMKVSRGGKTRDPGVPITSNQAQATRGTTP